MNRLFLSVALGAICLVPVGGSAQTATLSRNENWNRCQDNDPELSMAGCTAIIDSSGENAATRATAFRNRSTAYLGKGEYDKAIADCDAALRLKPDDVLVYDNRGNAYLSKGEFDKAIADFDTVIRLKPALTRAFSRRGYSDLFAGRYADAAADLQKGSGQGSLSAYNVLWLHLARVRSGQDDAQEFSRNVAKLDLKAWPGPVVALFLQQTTPEQVLAAAASSDPRTQGEQNCVAEFFLGEKALLDGKTADAEHLFVQARSICPTSFLQSQGALAELRQLKK
jgi:lipoprotein NlpI